MNMGELRNAIYKNMLAIERTVNISDSFMEYGVVTLDHNDSKERIAIQDYEGPIIYITTLTDEEKYYAGIDPNNDMVFNIASALDEEVSGIVDASEDESLLYTFLYKFYYVNLLEQQMAQMSVKNVSVITEE